MAPALVLSSDDEPLLDEALGYAECLKKAGVTVRQHVFPAGTGWPSIYGGISRQVPSWQEGVCRQFSDFIRDIRIH